MSNKRLDKPRDHTDFERYSSVEPLVRVTARPKSWAGEPCAEWKVDVPPLPFVGYYVICAGPADGPCRALTAAQLCPAPLPHGGVGGGYVPGPDRKAQMVS